MFLQCSSRYSKTKEGDFLLNIKEESETPTTVYRMYANFKHSSIIRQNAWNYRIGYSIFQSLYCFIKSKTISLQFSNTQGTVSFIIFRFMRLPIEIFEAPTLDQGVRKMISFNKINCFLF